MSHGCITNGNSCLKKAVDVLLMTYGGELLTWVVYEPQLLADKVRCALLTSELRSFGACLGSITRG